MHAPADPPPLAPPPQVISSLAGREIAVIGLRRGGTGDMYHWLLACSWPVFFGLVVGAYVLVNILFAMAFLAGGDGIVNARPGSFADAFFFSVQTMATIGYGIMAPRTPWAHALVAIEAFAGMLVFALMTGLLFARFARPTARVLFSRIAVVGPHDGRPTLSFRMANERGNQIVEATVRVTYARREVSAEGHVFRRFYDLALTRSHNQLFTLSWAVFHPIDAASPLQGRSAATMAAEDGELIISVAGIDDTMGQPVHARWAFAPGDVRWDCRFVDVIDRTATRTTIDYRKFHDAVSLTPEPGHAGEDTERG